jgi:beta-glucanase (GH16 family)
MKKIINLGILAFLLASVGQISAQTEKLLNGSFASSTSWTVGTTSAGVVGDAQFGQTADLPAGSVNTTCLKLSQGGTGKPEVQVYQKVQLSSTQMYKISAKIKCTNVLTVNRAVQIYIIRNAAADNGTMFTDATINKIDALGVDRSKGVSLFLEGWPFSSTKNTTANLNGAMPVSFDGTNTEFFKPPVTGNYIVLIKCGQWAVTTPFSVTISDLSLVTSAVTSVPVTSVSTTSSLALTKLGETSQLTASLVPAGATNKNVTWTSSNTAVATVSSTGLVTAIANGNAVVTVTTADGAKTATCAIYVTTHSFNLVWEDDFNGTGAPDPAKWGYETGYIRNNELQYYTKELKNASQSNGQLDINVIKEPTNGYQYSSASIISHGKFDQVYGKIEGRFKIPSGKGLWGCFWTLGYDYYQVWWPKSGELDIFEHINTEKNVHHTAWFPDLTGKKTSNGDTSVVADVTQWHVYSMEWTPSKVTWFVDGVKGHELNILNGVNNTFVFHKPHYILLNLVMGGDWPGVPDPNITKATMSCDWVKVYKYVPDVPLKVTGLSVTPSSMTIVNKGNPMQLSVGYIPTLATNKSVTWSSSNVAVATVSSTGLVSGVGFGDATITATSTDGAVTASSQISVLDVTVLISLRIQVLNLMPLLYKLLRAGLSGPVII